METFGICLSISMFFISLWNFISYMDTGNIKNGIMSVILLGCAFHSLYLAISFEKKED